MAYNDDFELWKEQIEALPVNEIRLPDRPIDLKAAQAETLRINAQEDKEVLMGAGADWTLVEDLTTLPGALRHTQAQWMSDYLSRQENQENWIKRSPLAYELRDEMFHHMSFAYRNLPDVNKKVMRIREGSGHADMIQDLIELAVLAEKYPEPLAQINFDTSLIAKAKETSREMAELLALNNGSKDESNAVKLLRDKAFTLLDDRMRKIREVGQYVFWRNPDRKEKYTDDYK